MQKGVWSVTFEGVSRKNDVVLGKKLEVFCDNVVAEGCTPENPGRIMARFDLAGTNIIIRPRYFNGSEVLGTISVAQEVKPTIAHYPIPRVTVVELGTDKYTILHDLKEREF